jgi:UTP-glucose-1-phosphate uridylyltransferase
VILARTLQVVRSGPSAAAPNPEDEAVEQRLMKVLVQFFQSDSALSDENLELGRIDYSVSMLQNLRQCIKTVMVSQMEKSRLREALLSSRYRAEAMHNIILAGDKIAKHLTESSAAAQQWVEMREAFMAMLDA